VLQLLDLVAQARKVCPGMGCRAIYHKYSKQIPLGRDKAIELMLDLGLGVKQKASHVRTTQAGLREFPNLLVNKQVNNINQVWQADMTYYTINNQHCYIILITDVYSQRIVGSGAFKNAFATHFLQVLDQAIRLRKKQKTSLSGLIHHSDGGKQYEAIIYKNRCLEHNIKQSMCIYSWENPYAENTNHQIKNRYLKHWKPKSFEQLCKELKQAVYNHNHFQVKKALGRQSPVDFEKQLVHTQNPQSRYDLCLKPSNPTLIY
jgi:transposase InsO family protein